MTLHRLARLYELKFKFVNAQLQEKQLNYSFRVKRKRCNGDLWVAMKFLVSLVFVFPLSRVSEQGHGLRPLAKGGEGGA